MQLEMMFRVVEGTAEVVTEAVAEGVAGGAVDSVAEHAAERGASEGASEGATEVATEGGAAEAAAGGAGNGAVTKPAVAVDQVVIEGAALVLVGLVGAAVRGLIAGMLAGLLIEYWGGPAISTAEAAACGAALSVLTERILWGDLTLAMGGRVVTRFDGPSLTSRCGTRWSVVPRGVRRGPRVG